MLFTGFVNGLTYYADSGVTTINGPEEYTLDVYTKDWEGRRQPDFHGLYRTEKGAVKALWRRFPGGGWTAR